MYNAVVSAPKRKEKEEQEEREREREREREKKKKKEEEEEEESKEEEEMKAALRACISDRWGVDVRRPHCVGKGCNVGVHIMC